jgi:hypothetical protein
VEHFYAHIFPLQIHNCHTLSLKQKFFNRIFLRQPNKVINSYNSAAKFL